MQILNREAPTLVTNIEVYHMLRHRYYRQAIGKTDISLSKKQLAMELQLHHYLKPKVKHITREMFMSLWNYLSTENHFTDIQRFQILNEIPQTPAELSAVLQGSPHCFTEEEIEEAFSFLSQFLKKQPRGDEAGELDSHENQQQRS